MESASSDIADIKRQLRQVRTSVGTDVHDLVEGARAITDWHRYWRHHPWAWCGAATVLGYFCVPQRRFGNADARRLAALSEPATGKSPVSRSRLIISELAGMALGILVQQGKQLVAQRVASVWNSRIADPVPLHSARGTDREHS